LGSEVVATGVPDRATLDVVVVGPGAADVRRAVGPVAWCALEYLVASPARAHGEGDTVAASVRSLATALRVSKNIAHRAFSVLREVGLVESMQSRGDDGHFQPAAIGSPSPRTSSLAFQGSSLTPPRRGVVGRGRLAGAGSPWRPTSASSPSSSSCFRRIEFVVCSTTVDLASDLVCRQVPERAIRCRV
jgi:hypothetical protein